VYFSNHILDKAEILQENIRYIKIYCGKFSGQMELGNITFQRVKFSKLILSTCVKQYFSCTIWDISRATGGILLQLKLG
jgi:hypothetical protein